MRRAAKPNWCSTSSGVSNQPFVVLPTYSVQASIGSSIYVWCKGRTGNYGGNGTLRPLSPLLSFVQYIQITDTVLLLKLLSTISEATVGLVSCVALDFHHSTPH